MTLPQSIFLGIIQGLTEFLPISSSGHLVIIPYLLGWKLPQQDAFIFDVLVQVATLAGVFAYFWKDILAILKAFVMSLFTPQSFKDPLARQGWLILVATLPAGVIGVALKGPVESAFNSPQATGFFLFVTAGILIGAERLGRREKTIEQLTWQDALWIGLAQAVAIFPGISRSGSTIAGGMARRLQRPSAARFSFLLSIPIMLAAGGLAGLDLLEIPNLTQVLPVFIPGFIAAAVTGYFTIRWLLGFLQRRPLTVFAIYCILAGIITIIRSVW
jgi:undecaprenyl-diphosphatase